MRHYTLECGCFDLGVYGNGLAYTLTHVASHYQAFFQGDDATQFESDWESIETTFPHFTREQIASYLWNECEYSLCASHY